MNEKRSLNKKGSLFGVSAIIVFILVLFWLIVSIDSVPAGHVGVMDKFGVVSDKLLSPGMYWTGAFTSTKSFSTRTQKFEYVASSASKDLQIVNTEITLNFRLLNDKAIETYKNIGQNYEEIIIRPIIQEAVKSQTAKYNAEEIITRREEVKGLITDYIISKLSNKGIEVMEVAITNFDFSDEFNKAIEQKQVAEQMALKAERDLDRVKTEAQQNIEMAKAEAESLRIQKTEITQETLQQRWIEKWDGHLPTVVAGESSNLLMMVGGER